MTQLPAIVTAWICCGALFSMVWEFAFAETSVKIDLAAFSVLATTVFTMAAKNAYQYYQGKKLDNSNAVFLAHNGGDIK